jgi:hypothetical protein
MRRFGLAMVAAIALTLTLALAVPAGAGASTNWVCKVPEDGKKVTVTFVSAGDAAYDGISTANGTAGEVFHDQFGEKCKVVSDSD